MPKNSEEGCHKLAKFSQKACAIVRRVDEDLTDRLSLMDLSLPLDGFGKLCNDISKACEVSKLAKISEKCVDFAKKFADEVSADWLGLDVNPSNSESVDTICENYKTKLKLIDDEEGLDDLTVSGVSNVNSVSINVKNASDHQCEIKPSSGALVQETEEQQNKGMFDVSCSKGNTTPNKINADEILSLEAPQNNMTADVLYAEGDLTPNEANGTEVLSSEALEEGRKSNTSLIVYDALQIALGDQVLPLEAQQNNITADVEEDFVPKEANGTEVLSAEALEDSMKSNMSLIGYDALRIVLDVSEPRDDSSSEADNLINFSKPLEFGPYEDIELKDDWEDDTDYDLSVVSYYESKKKPLKKRMAAKFISRWRRRPIKSQSGEVAPKPDVNSLSGVFPKPDVKSADSDWELL